jgi:hypothetical protein
VNEATDLAQIIGAPAFFPTVWGWIKRWFDPITVSKIFILSHADVFPTLSQYIDPENIPKKYGGKLDFTWGDMPHLEPEIESAIEWLSPETQKGRNTYPIGSMIWEKNADGSMTAVAVGTEKGQSRHRPIFRIPHPVNAPAELGERIPNTHIAEDELALTTVGTHTQPADPDPATIDLEPPPSDSTTTSGTPSESQATTLNSDLKDMSLREGTSDTRFEQQHNTHAAGQLADGTPDAAVVDHGLGDKTFTMEPSTVGQAPKDVSIKPEEPPAPSYLDQAKQMAAQASAAVTSTVGSAANTVTGMVGGKKEEHVEEKTSEQKAREAEIDGTENHVIEGFLREKTRTS